MRIYVPKMQIMPTRPRAGMKLGRVLIPWQAAAMLQELLIALGQALLSIAVWWLPVVYFAAVGYVAYTVGGHNEQARNWIVGLSIAVFILGVLLLDAWSR